MNNKRNAVIAALFEKKNKRKPKNSQELQDFVQSQGGEEFLKKVDEYIAQAEKDQAQKAQKAAHGAKLQYFRKLKNKCAEDEELVYYKKGGKVECGCQKKGGEISKEPKKQSVVDKFKATRKADIGMKFGGKKTVAFKSNSKQQQKDPKEGLMYDPKTKKFRKKTEEEKRINQENLKYTQQTGNEERPESKNSKTKLQKKGGEVCPKCGKIHAAGMGCHLSKIKVSCSGSTLKK